jgi:hypothetical protein
MIPQRDRLAGLDGALCLLRHWTVCLDVPSPAATSVTDAPLAPPARRACGAGAPVTARARRSW